MLLPLQFRSYMKGTERTIVNEPGKRQCVSPTPENSCTLSTNSLPSILNFERGNVSETINQSGARVCATWPKRTMGFYCSPIPMWPPKMSADQKARFRSCHVTKMAVSTKVSHVGKQPTSLDRGLGSVSRISMATQSLKRSIILAVFCGPKWQKSVRQAATTKTEKLGSEVWLIGIQSE